ncbi:carbonic anhydrase [Pollutimonas thiosulfatoxidans]|uniref:carbonic anhydrase n=1 Tax=Pollutimonas thiosulfatoxidans TaxID=2028345 RepID=A0A410G9U7_9BURK|nr:carbonic anhydrase [Pollutimonas thiosulfatoxidans]QAA93041.1 carbonic anhydrase [Pollutimonas thiosulfatoxidans]
MCNLCARRAEPSNSPSSPSRRAAISMVGAISLLGMSATARAAQSRPPPKPDNALTPDQAVERLMEGNGRYTSGTTYDRDFSSERAALAGGQNPYACILSCADSRVSPELCFDEERGDLFVTRVAGNYVTNDLLASLEYGVAVLHAPLIMVLGHTRCGALSATVSALEKQTEFPGHIQTLVTALMPAVRAVQAQAHADTLVQAATIENIKQNVQRLKQATPILSNAFQNSRIRVIGGLYDLETGKVDLVA